jgi:hypothetical protein
VADSKVSSGGIRALAGFKQWSENQDEAKQPEVRVAATLEHCLCALTSDLKEFYTVALALVHFTKLMKVRFADSKLR